MLAKPLTTAHHRSLTRLKRVVLVAFVGFAQYWVANPDDPSGNPHYSLAVRVYQDGDEAVPDVYPLPHARGIVQTGDKDDPDFESIITKLREAARR